MLHNSEVRLTIVRVDLVRFGTINSDSKNRLDFAESHGVLSDAVLNAKCSSRLPELAAYSILVPKHAVRVPVFLEGKKSHVVPPIEGALPVRFCWICLAHICTHFGS